MILHKLKNTQICKPNDYNNYKLLQKNTIKKKLNKILNTVTPKVQWRTNLIESIN